MNPASIRRRIYECCKVLRILGFIQKVGKHYQWVLDGDSPRIKVEEIEIKKKAKRLKRLQMTEAQLIT